MVMEDSALFSISDKPETVNTTREHTYNVAHVYDIDENPDDELQKKRKLARNCCWNCGGSGHSLRQCPQPHNPSQISRNRALFTTRNEFKRYHVDLKEDIYPHLKPGVISDKLREALGLKEDQLPEHVYRMRVLGYPPGWLLEAKNDSSGIEMFDNDGNRVPNADEEDGEIGGITSVYDESKIISYPGFNEWPPPETLDESRNYGVPELKYMLSKHDFIKSLKKIEFSADYLSAPQTNNATSSVEAGECDMETEDIESDIQMLPEDGRCTFIPPLPDENELPPPPPPMDPGVGKIQIAEVESGDAAKDEDLPSKKSEFEVEKNMLNDIAVPSHGRIVSIELGTPVLKIHSPYNKLPPAEAFQKDISDVINFENLPDSTGAYEKLKGVLKNVRTKMSLLKETKLNSTI